MNIMVILLIVIFIILIIGGIAFLIFKNKGNKKFEFWIYSRDLKFIEQVYGKITKDTNNRDVFFLPKLNRKIDIKERTRYFNNKAIRELVYTTDGSLAYVKESKLNEDKYTEYSLSPEDKQIALYRLREIAQRFTNAMNRTEQIIMISFLIMCIIIVLGNCFVGYQMVKMSKNLVEANEQISETAINVKSLAVTNNAVIEQMASINSLYYNNMNITRRLT